jgi:glycosyltransferase involved in cell wall biosynthesis
VLQDTSGGGVTHVLELARHAAGRGTRVTIAVPGPALDAEVPSLETIRIEPLPLRMPARTAEIVRLGVRADLVHAHGTHAATWALPALWARPSVVTFHGLHPLRREAGTAYRIAARGLVRAIAGAADSCICVSESERDDALRAGVPATALTVVRNGVAAQALVGEDERANARAALALTDRYAVLFLGRLHDQKDPLTAVRVATGMADEGVVLLIAGDGELGGAVAAAATPNVEVLGHRADVRRLLAGCDVVLNTSRWEGLPLALLEAMWAGRPVVASDAPGNREVLGDAGILVPPGDVEAFQSALRRLRAPERRARLAAHGRVRAASFGLGSMLAATDAVYERVATR